MTFVVKNLTQETSITTGTGTYDLAGATADHLGFVAAIGNGNTCPYTARMGSVVEAGIGTVTDATPDTLARTTVLSAGGAVDWAAGTKIISCGLPAELAMMATRAGLTDLDWLQYDAASGLFVPKTTAQVHTATAGLVFLSRQDAASSAALAFTSLLTSTYDQYEIHIADIVPATDNVHLYLALSTDNGATWASASYWYANTIHNDVGTWIDERSASAAIIKLAGDCGSGTGEQVSGRIWLLNLLGAKYKSIRSQFSQVNQNSAQGVDYQGVSGIKVTTAYNAVRLIMASGNIASGYATLYGVRKS